MAFTGEKTFDTTLQKTNELLKEIEDAMGWTNRRDQAYQALRVVLHGFRDRLPVNESVHFASQLPLLVKGIYFDGWRPADVPKKIDRQEFMEEIRSKFFYQIEGSIEDMVKAILGKIFDKFEDTGEKEKIKNLLPEELADLVK